MLSLDQIRAVPKVLLHDHLDGGLRPETVLELAREIGYQDLPGDNVEELTRRLTEGAHRGHLEIYLDEVVEAVLAGFREGSANAARQGRGITVYALLTAMRTAARSLEIAELAVR